MSTTRCLRATALTSDLARLGWEDEPGDLLGINVEASPAADLLLGEVVGVGLGDAELLEALEHDGGKGALALLGGAETVEELLVGLGRLVEVASVDGGGCEREREGVSFRAPGQASESKNAPSKLLAAVVAWMSPVKWRLNSSMGMT